MWKRYTDHIDIGESFVSILLGFLVVVVAGLLIFNFFSRNQRSKQNQQVAGIESTIALSPTSVPNPTALPTVRPTEIPTLTPKPTITQIPTATKAPSPTASATPSPTTKFADPNTTTHTVVANESLWSIAEKEYGSGYRWVDIAKANSIQNPGILSVGQILTLPKTGQPDEKVSSASTVSEQKYTVVKGDNLWKIAVKIYGDGYGWTKIAQANNLTDPSKIYSGNILIIPEYHRP